MVAHTCNLSTLKVEAVRMQGRGQPALHRQMLSQKNQSISQSIHRSIALANEPVPRKSLQNFSLYLIVLFNDFSAALKI